MAKNPLGPVPQKSQREEWAKESVAIQEAVHRKRAESAVARRASPLWVVTFIVVASALGYLIVHEFILAKKVPEAPPVDAIVTSWLLAGDLSPIEPMLDESPKVLIYESLSPDEQSLLKRQSELFFDIINLHNVKDADLLTKPSMAFPEMLYFTRPVAGKSQIGDRSTLEDKVGSSNVFTMSYSLWGSFRDQMEQSGGSPSLVTLKGMQQQAMEAYRSRDPSAPENQNQDDFNRNRDLADMEWLNQFNRYLTENIYYQQALEKAAAKKNKVLEEWNSFFGNKGKGLAESLADRQSDAYTVQPVFRQAVPDDHVALVEITVREQAILLDPAILNTWFEIR